MAGEQGEQKSMAGSEQVELKSMAEEQGEQKSMAGSEQVEQGSSIEQKVEEVVTEFYEHEELNKPLLHQQELADLFRILKDNKAAISQLPQDKKDDLAALLPKIRDALELCKTPSSEDKKTTKKKKKKPALKMGDCNPFKSRTDHKDAADDDVEPPSSLVTPLLGQTKALLSDYPAPAAASAAEEVVYYEWTTSYVDETRLYGWDDKAKDVADALAGPENDDPDAPPFRAAGIFGIHGSGKTVLAQKVFIHDRIKDTFPLRLWVCVGPDHKDKFNLLYRMLDNLGLDTSMVEDVVNNSEVVKKHAGGDQAAAERSKIGVLLFILHVALTKTSYLIVFDDIRADDNSDYWYTNLLLPPPTDGEWNDRLAYGLPKMKKSAVLVTCRKEEQARAMVRTGRVFHPPLLEVADAWKLFKREYVEAKKKELQGAGGGGGGGEYNRKADKLYKELKEMKKEIVGKCLGLPVAIVEAAKGFAQREYVPSDDDDDKHQDAAAAGNKDADAGEAASASDRSKLRV